MVDRKRSHAAAACPLRMDQPCNLCHPDAYLGPQDCPTVAMVLGDPELRGQLDEARAQYRIRRGA